jgi:hypothetical protein
MQVWMLVQRKWMYLESIFIGSDDIRNQLPQETKRFDTIDKAWLKIMADTAKNTNVLEACSADGRCDRRHTVCRAGSYKWCAGRCFVVQLGETSKGYS